MKRWQILTGLFVILIVAAMFIPARGWLIHFDGPYEGQVLDDETGEPIEGAAVVAVWRLALYGGPGGPIGRDFADKEVITDKKGEFKIPSIIGFYWWPFSSMDKADIYIYKPGYDSYPPQLEIYPDKSRYKFSNIQEKSMEKPKQEIVIGEKKIHKLHKVDTFEERFEIARGQFLIMSGTPSNVKLFYEYRNRELQLKNGN